jgi:AraC family transcriptional regulator
MKTFTLKGGQYAVFNHKGSSTDNSIYQYIFTQWLPNSGYQIDNRPHFELLGEKYKNNDPNSEEEIWVPIKK